MGDTTTKHTPGPWMTDGTSRQAFGQIGVFGPGGVACVALIQPGCLPEDGREDAAKANAYLVAAAPEMLEALRLALPILAQEAGDDDGAATSDSAAARAYNAARAVLTKGA